MSRADRQLDMFGEPVAPTPVVHEHADDEHGVAPLSPEQRAALDAFLALVEGLGPLARRRVAREILRHPIFNPGDA